MNKTKPNHENNSYRFLIVEDNYGDYLLLKNFLELSNLNIVKIRHASNMSEARKLIEANQFDITLLDLSLPDSVGIDSVITVERLLPGTPIVVLSGLSTIEMAAEAISLGAQDYIVKGEFDEKLLAKTVQYSVERKRRIQELAEQRIEQQKLITEITLEVQEKEKNQLGRELHDNITQLLAIVKMYLGILKSRWGDPKEELIGKSYEYVVTAMEELRKLSHSLVTPVLQEGGFQKVIRELVDDINSFKRLHITLHVDEIIKKGELEKGKELMIYRILQEQLNNIIKYAQANKVTISIKIEEAHLVLLISDNGVGFDPVINSNGIGLKNIKSRVDFYSGTTNINSSPGNGCSIEVNVPLH